MADLGSAAALTTDIDAKVTTNGANENTGARVNDCLNNIADTLYGSGIRRGSQSIVSTTTALGNAVGTVYLVTATCTLPASPDEDREVTLYNADTGTNSTVGRNGKLINGAAADYTIGPGQVARLKYTGGAWYDLNRFSPVMTKAALGVPNIYRATVSNAGAIQTTIVNQLGVTFTWDHPGAGQMRISADSGTPFTVLKTTAWAMPTSGGGGGTLCDTDADADTAVINFYFFDPLTGNAADPPGNFQAFIEVHP